MPAEMNRLRGTIAAALMSTDSTPNEDESDDEGTDDELDDNDHPRQLSEAVGEDPEAAAAVAAPGVNAETLLDMWGDVEVELEEEDDNPLAVAHPRKRITMAGLYRKLDAAQDASLEEDLDTMLAYGQSCALTTARSRARLYAEYLQYKKAAKVTSFSWDTFFPLVKRVLRDLVLRSERVKIDESGQEIKTYMKFQSLWRYWRDTQLASLILRRARGLC